jgi:tetratricopeptide (TPR) repeat protein
MVARPLLERLEAVRGAVDLTVLRPATLEALHETLSEAMRAGEPFQVVHFDGHGLLPGLGGAAPGTTRREREAVLVFEKPDGGAEDVPSSRLAQVLAASGVAVVVLNACQSGAVDDDLNAAMATRLLQAGVTSVVAMAYRVYAVAAAEFMAALYERIFAGDTLATAVTAGRQRMFRRNQRPSPKGDLPLEDWIIPVHYLRHDVRFPHARVERGTNLPSLEEYLDKLRAPQASGAADDLEPVGQFIGRDDLFLQLEVAVRRQRVIVLHGPAGTGKTEVAKGFARWWRDTGGVGQPDWVFWYSFEPGLASLSLDGLLAQIGERLFGPDFLRLEAEERRRVVLDVLSERRMLLVWDNFETIRSMPDPDGSAAALSEAATGPLRDFLQRLGAFGSSAVLVTSRTPEEWLGDIRRIRVAGLTSREATEYAGYLLAPYPSAVERRGRRAFAELMEWLDGHPLSMRLILPRLDAEEPEALLQELKGMRPLAVGPAQADDRATSLPASLSYSYAHLSPATRRLLPAASLFRVNADVTLLSQLADSPQAPQRFRDATFEEWDDVLGEAARVGLLARMDLGYYRIHPALPGYLAAGWRQEDPDGYSAARDMGVRALLGVCVEMSLWLRWEVERGSAGVAFAIMGLHHRTLGSLLGYALDQRLWHEAQQLSQALQDFWVTRGWQEEARAWADRVLLATADPDGSVPPLDTPAGALWMFFADNEAVRHAKQHSFDEAERVYHRMLAALEAQPPSRKRQRYLAIIYQELAIIAQEREDLHEAERWHRASLAINEELGRKEGIGANYHGLGNLDYMRGRLDEASKWYQASLAVGEELGDMDGMSNDYHQLGMVARDQERLDDAEGWFRKSMAIVEELRDEAGMADSYHELGNLALVRGQLDEAETWYARSLIIKEEQHDRPGLADSYYQLGMLAQERGRFHDAEDWYRKAAAVEERLGNRRGLAASYRQLGGLAEQCGQPVQALEWTIRWVALYPQFPHPATEPAAGSLARLAAGLDASALSLLWLQVTGKAIPATVAAHVHAYNDHASGEAQR